MRFDPQYFTSACHAYSLLLLRIGQKGGEGRESRRERGGGGSDEIEVKVAETIRALHLHACPLFHTVRRCLSSPREKWCKSRHNI